MVLFSHDMTSAMISWSDTEVQPGHVTLKTSVHQRCHCCITTSIKYFHLWTSTADTPQPSVLTSDDLCSITTPLPWVTTRGTITKKNVPSPNSAEEIFLNAIAKSQPLEVNTWGCVMTHPHTSSRWCDSLRWRREPLGWFLTAHLQTHCGHRDTNVWPQLSCRWTSDDVPAMIKTTPTRQTSLCLLLSTPDFNTPY